jgi:DNA-directed RNA polymerase subunit RPC12/RpoP
MTYDWIIAAAVIAVVLYVIWALNFPRWVKATYTVALAFVVMNPEWGPMAVIANLVIAFLALAYAIILLAVNGLRQRRSLGPGPWCADCGAEATPAYRKSLDGHHMLVQCARCGFGLGTGEVKDKPRRRSGPWCLCCGNRAPFHGKAIDNKHVIVRCEYCGVGPGTFDYDELHVEWPYDPGDWLLPREASQ